MFTAQQLRSAYTKFFESKGHTIITTAPLVPENDPTVLFTTAGMHPLVPYLLGQPHPGGVKLVNVQKCVRTGDIDEVGDATHLTFFEMLGNWSLGDYFKKDAITWSFEFLTQELGLPLSHLAFTVFEGDTDAPRDEEAAELWKSLGVKPERIAYLPKKDNWWGPAGQTGPCGPDTEMFYYTGSDTPPQVYDPSDKCWVEIWNDVFMQYDKQADGTYIPLKQQNVDTGMGLERTLAVLNGHTTVYDTELFQPIIAKIHELAGSTLSPESPPEAGQAMAETRSTEATESDESTESTYPARLQGRGQEPSTNRRSTESTESTLSSDEKLKSTRIIADHIRTAVFMASDHVRPSNMDQGYVMRRIIRRAIRHAKKIGITGQFLDQLGQVVVDVYKDPYTSLSKYEKQIIECLFDEEEKFHKTLEQGLREVEKLVKQLSAESRSEITGLEAFHLYDTYGFPIEMTKDLADESGLIVDLSGFDEHFEKHQKNSRTTSAGMFKGGLADHSEETTRLHTATHLLQKALRIVLGDHVEQRGSNVTKDRTRFDFSHTEKMTEEQKAEVERLVNDAIEKALPVHFEIMTFEEAKKRGAIGVFEERYQEKIKVYFMGDFSTEVCGGPHVENTLELAKSGRFKIKKEEASSAGVRRIKAVLA